jgi:hypothetical protein
MMVRRLPCIDSFSGSDVVCWFGETWLKGSKLELCRVCINVFRGVADTVKYKLRGVADS